MEAFAGAWHGWAMGLDLTTFKGSSPYASQLFGIYQPLLGWRSRQHRRRVSRDIAERVACVIQAMQRDPQMHGGAASGPPVVDWLAPAVGSRFEAATAKFTAQNRRSPKGGEWAAVVESMKLDTVVQDVEKAAERHGGKTTKLAVERRGTLTRDEIAARGGVEIASSGIFVTSARAGARTTSAGAESMSANIVKAFATMAPELLDVVAYRPNRWMELLGQVDPLNGFDPETQDAVLSPIGVLQLYRQFFFELDSFLGPAVAHVWISPGTTLELIETHTRKSLYEKIVSTKTFFGTKQELKSQESDELSERISSQNTSSTSLGVSASAGVNFGVFQANAAVNVSLASTRQTSQEVAHKTTREQSQQLSTELRREFKTSIRTVLESEDTSARNYKIQNPTDKLINYELKRKMRRVAVQLQSIGAQLCWQVYVDDPGHHMGVAELVHVAQPSDSSAELQPPEAPQPLPAQESDITVDFPFQVASDYPDSFEVIVNGEALYGTIDWKKTVRATAPGPGYKLAFVNQKDVQGTQAEAEGPGLVSASFHVVAGKDDTFAIHLDQVQFVEQPAIRFFLTLSWSPPDQAEAFKVFNEQWADYEQRKARAAHEDYVRAVRERVKAATQILPRAGSDLRAEERTTIFSRLVHLLRPGAADESDHVTVELIRALFEVDKMLYFVAESWWKPRKYRRQQVGSSGTEVLTAKDKVGWGDVDAKSRRNYLVTEDSLPVPRGASLGWLLQLDGDEHRNAFLNSPFVKAVIPIRRGREKAALEWLKRAQVEGSDGLDVPYRGTEPALQGKTLEQAILALGAEVAATATNTATLAAEKVFEEGFDPLEGGFSVDRDPLEVFDQWIEILPTDQIVAVDYPTP
jgi:hypothetical protein